jgi:hypothetical protein
MRKSNRFVFISRAGIFQEATKITIIIIEEKGKNDFIEEEKI